MKKLHDFLLSKASEKTKEAFALIKEIIEKNEPFFDYDNNFSDEYQYVTSANYLTDYAEHIYHSLIPEEMKSKYNIQIEDDVLVIPDKYFNFLVSLEMNAEEYNLKDMYADVFNIIEIDFKNNNKLFSFSDSTNYTDENYIICMGKSTGIYNNKDIRAAFTDEDKKAINFIYENVTITNIHDIKDLLLIEKDYNISKHNFDFFILMTAAQKQIIENDNFEILNQTIITLKDKGYQKNNGKINFFV